MGTFRPVKYKKLNRLTGLFEWVYPPDQEYDQKDTIKSIVMPGKKNKKKWR